jgi:hypothetical protein
MATHNIDDGTGGLDASLYFELDRDEVRSKGILCEFIMITSSFHRTLVSA